MKSSEILLVILLSIGAIQGMVYGIILWRNNGINKIANRFLSTIIYFFTYRLLVEILKLFGIGYYDAWYHILLEYNWVYGALIYFFIKACIIPNFKLSLKKDWFHFIPVGIEFIWSNFIKSQNFFWDGTRESLSWLGYWGYVVWMQYPTIYIICSALIIYYSIKSEQLLNTQDNPNILYKNTQWIRRIIKVLKIYSIFIIVIVLFDFFFFDYAFNRFYHYPLFVGMALITYWLCIEGFNKKDDIIIKFKNILSKKEQNQIDNIAKRLKSLMVDDKVFKNPDISLSSLSEQLQAKPYMTTKCLNSVFGKKFNDFINEYRIEEVKTLLKNPKYSNYTLLAIAFEAGFNSKASFNRSVKKVTGKSPIGLKST